ncbi:MAG: DEAD/DEAH box helicase [Gammaproteobacteria bacterium]|nr:DEAD/DEAH box helicase [Gammaproteobacteria bacterium]
MNKNKLFTAVQPESIRAYKTYLSYNTEEREVLQVFAVLHRCINQTQMNALLEILHQTQGFGPQESIMGKAFREKALQDGLLSSRGNLLHCHEDIVLLLIMETIEQGNFERITKVTEVQIPFLTKKTMRHASNAEIEMDYLRQTRMALFTRDDEALLDLLSVENYQYPIQQIDFNSLINIAKPFFSPVFNYFTPQARYFIVADALQDKNKDKIHLSTTVPLLQQILADIKTQSTSDKKGDQAVSPTFLLAQQYLRSAEFSQAEWILSAYSNSWIALAIQAKIKTMKGDFDDAIAQYQQALSIKKKSTRKRETYIPNEEGIFYILALLAKNKPAETQLARQALTLPCKESDDPLFHLLNELVNVITDNIDWEETHSLRWDSPGLGADYILFWSLCRCWLRKKISNTGVVYLKNASQKAKNSGYYWYYIETQLILSKISPSSVVDPGLKVDPEVKTKKLSNDSLGWTPLIDLIRPLEKWQKVLSSLQAISQPPGASRSSDMVAVSEKTSRMTWRIQFYGNDCVLHPKEQVMGKTGKWSAGRSVSLERLHEESNSIDYLTDQDRQMCLRIESEVEYQRYGRYLKTYYSASGAGLLKAAIGHPLLFLHDEPGQSIELCQAEIVLEIQSKKEQFSLKITPYPGQDADYMVTRISARQAQFIELTPQHRKILEIVTKKGITLPLQAKQQLLDTIRAIAPLMTVHSDIAGNTGNDAVDQVKANPHPQIHIQPCEEGLLFECYVQPFAHDDANQGPLFRPGHGRAIILSEINAKSLQASRDLKLEKQQAQKVLDQCPLLDEHSDGYWPLTETEDALETLLQLQTLDQDPENNISIMWPQGKKLKLNQQHQLSQMQVTLKKKKDWFELDGQLTLDDGQIIAMQDLFDLLQASPGRFMQLKTGEFLALTDELKSRLSNLQFARGKNQLHALTAPLVDELTDGMSVKSGKHWKTLLERAEQARQYEPELPSTLQAELRDYQMDGFKWLSRLAQWGAGACLADDMGLGKTLQALAFILTRAAQGPTLVIAPTSVCFNWIDEIRRFTPTLKVKHFGFGDRQKMLDEAEAMDVIICSYGLLQAQSEKLTQVLWHTIIADEAQAFKNTHTKRSRAMMSLQGDYIMILTGTPIENHLGEFWNLFRFINPGLLGSLEGFNKQFAAVIENNPGKDVAKEASQRLKNLIQPFILRRMKTDVLTELPSRTEITLHIVLSAEETALYEALRRKAVETLAEIEDRPGQKRMKILAEIMRLRRACCHPKLVMPEVDISSSKLQAFAEIIEELLENRHKALVFSQFVGHLDIIREFLDQKNIHYQYLDGSTPQKKRKIAIDAFQSGAGDLFLISLKAGGSGLNLTAADYVIHMDPWWNPAVEDQASDRAHRMGQTRPVTIYRLVTLNTIENKIVQLHQQKRELANNLLEGSEMSGKMSADDMYNLIKDAY